MSSLLAFSLSLSLLAPSNPQSVPSIGLGETAEDFMPRVAAVPTTIDWWTDGIPRQMALSGSTLYAVGPFTHVGPYAGGFSIRSASDGSSVRPPPYADGIVHAIESDGAGGWYVAGPFNGFDGGSQGSLVHIASDGTFLSFNANLSGGNVTRLELAGQRLFLGGNFTSVGGQPRDKLAAVDAATGAVLPWASGGSGFNGGAVNALFHDAGVLFVGGNFSQSFSGAQRTNVVALDAQTGAVLPWNPAPNQGVWDFCAVGDQLAVQGSFSQIAATNRPGIAFFDRATLGLSSFSPAIVGSACRLAAHGNTLYMAGAITTAQGQPRLGGAAYDVSTGTLLPWEPRTLNNNGTAAYLEDIAADSTGVYVVGELVSAHGQVRLRTAKLDPLTGAPLSWRAHAAGGGSHVFSISVADGEVALGGDFTIVGGEPRSGIAAWNLDDGTLLPFAPTFTNNQGFASLAHTMDVEGTRIWVGGTFMSVNGTSRPKIAALDAVTGQLDPNFVVPGTFHPSGDSVTRLTVGGGRLYISGRFDLAGGTMSGLGALDPATGALLPGFVSGGSHLTEMALSKDLQTLWVSGSFGSMGIPPVNTAHLAKLNALTGAVLPWNAGITNSVSDFEFVGTGLAVTGNFLMVNNQLNRYLARVDGTTGNLIPFAVAPSSAPNSGFNSCARLGQALFVTGGFTQYGSQGRNGIVALNTRTGEVLDWDPDADHAPYRATILNQRLYVTGLFRRISGQRMPSLAIYQLSMTSRP